MDYKFLTISYLYTLYIIHKYCREWILTPWLCKANAFGMTFVGNIEKHIGFLFVFKMQREQKFEYLTIPVILCKIE